MPVGSTMFLRHPPSRHPHSTLNPNRSLNPLDPSAPQVAAHADALVG